MVTDTYRKQFSAILESIDMPKFERYTLIGGFVQEIQAEYAKEMGKKKEIVSCAHQVFADSRSLDHSMERLGKALEVKHD